MEKEKSITIYQGYEFRSYIGNIYNERDFFYEQYCQAARCIAEIVLESEKFIRQSEKNRGNDLQKKRALQRYPNNIIAFCAKRGNGKTSAMLSMSHALENLSVKKSSEQELFWERVFNTPLYLRTHETEIHIRQEKERIKNYSFLVMETIDPANMEQNDSILLNILSRMYHMWNEDFSRRRGRLDSEEERTSQKLIHAFQNAYRNVYSLKKPLNEDELDEYDGLTRLSEKGDSINVKHAFIELTEYFLKYFNKDMLVIQVDDADLNTERVYEIVEDIRKYCVGPSILVILAVHLDTLRNCIEQENVKRYRYLLDERILIPHLQRSKCREMAERYINKLIPGYHQIHLPYIDEWFRIGRTDIDLYYTVLSDNLSDTDLLNLDENKKILSYNYQHRLFHLIYEKTGIILMPAKSYLHNFLPRRYRDLSHFLSYFCDMEDIDVSGKGSLTSLLETCYGRKKSGRISEEQKIHRKLLGVRKKNLEKMMIYFLQYWCPVSLEKNQLKILQEIAAVPLKMKCQITIALLNEYCDKIQYALNESDMDFHLKGDIKFPDSEEDITYVHVMDILEQLKKQLNTEHKFEFLYAIKLYYSICMNLSFCIQMEKGEDFLEIIEMTGGKIFPTSSFYATSYDIEQDAVCIEFFQKMMKNKIMSPTEIGWDQLFRAVEFKGNCVDEKNEEILVRAPDDTGWMLNEEIRWMLMDFNKVLFHFISHEWISEHCYKESSNKNKNAFSGVSSALQLICNFDLRDRIRRYAFSSSDRQAEFVDKIQNLCKNMDNLVVVKKVSGKKAGKDPDPDDDMWIENPPAQYLELSMNMEESVINELLGMQKIEYGVPSYIHMLNAASPRKCILKFFQIVEAVAEGIGLEDSGENDWWQISDFCDSAYLEHGKYLEYLGYINAFREYLELCRDFINKEKISNPKTEQNEKRLRRLRIKTSGYLEIRPSVLDDCKKMNLDHLVENLNDENWITEKMLMKSIPY